MLTFELALYDDPSPMLRLDEVDLTLARYGVSWDEALRVYVMDSVCYPHLETLRSELKKLGWDIVDEAVEF